MPTFCSLPLPSYYSNNFTGTIDASLSIVVFSINDPDLPYMMYYLWIYVAIYEEDRCLVVIYACAKTTLFCKFQTLFQTIVVVTGIVLRGMYIDVLMYNVFRLMLKIC